MRRVLEPILRQGADQIVLGCTHYPFLLPAIERVAAGWGAAIVDPSPAVARRVAQLLDRYALHAPADRAPASGSAPSPTRLTAGVSNGKRWGDNFVF